jgi:hypothetical protein
MRIIDNKHHIQGEQIFKTSNNTIISEEEPTILFRGRDKLAVRMLKFYRGLCVQDDCTDYQLESMDDMIKKFEDFAGSSPTMKQPGITKGK